MALGRLGLAKATLRESGASIVPDLVDNAAWAEATPLRAASRSACVTPSLRAIARTSPQTLHRPDLASFDMTGYDASHAEGFIRLFGLPLATVARRGEQGTQPAPSDHAPAEPEAPLEADVATP